jgi:transformer-2 protein
MCELYVANLSPDTTGPDLEKLFGRYGVVRRVHVATLDGTGSYRGYGIVAMAEGAERAVKALKGVLLRGRRLSVGVVRSADPSRDAVGAL